VYDDSTKNELTRFTFRDSLPASVSVLPIILPQSNPDTWTCRISSGDYGPRASEYSRQLFKSDNYSNTSIFMG
jgi:hypothetical protein